MNIYVDKSNSKGGLYIFERIIFNLVMKLYITIKAVVGSSKLGSNRTAKWEGNEGCVLDWF